MQKWEYIAISFSTEDYTIDEVNNKPIRKKYKDEEGNVSVNEKYKMHEYLTVLGKDGWDVVASLNSNLLIAKRPIAGRP